MSAMVRTLAVAVALAGSTLPAFAQGNPLSYSGVTFDAREGWCPKQAVSNGANTLEIRYCSNEGRYVSVLLMRPASPGQTYDVSSMANAASELLAGPEGKPVIEQAMSAGYGACTASDLVVDSNAVPGLPGFKFSALGTCVKDGVTELIDFANFSAYVVGTDGALWSIAFDHADAPITPDDQAYLKMLANRIAGR